jgi:hypothetical protein
VSSAQTIGLEKEPISVDEDRLSERECEEDSDDSALSLWDIACARLRREEPELMNAYANDLLTADSQPPTERQVTDEVPDGYYQERRLQELTLRKLDFLAEARWKITIGGKDFVVRDQIAKIARKVLSFKDSIGVAVSAEPHAALAWAGVLVILPVSYSLTTIKFSIRGALADGVHTAIVESSDSMGRRCRWTEIYIGYSDSVSGD